MLAELAVQGAAADAEFLRSQGAVAFAFPEGAPDERELGFPEVERERVEAL